ncbi:hypothetical protein C1H46_002210 [Malus baccata]|uniref:Uncharacterized protein n=1 Tax=Malus baccata TaxID=106549 RepID=A0A540NNP0_MALBA|nr:hypothetical protein C1H46_002210 [Malus baccata]
MNIAVGKRPRSVTKWIDLGVSSSSPANTSARDGSMAIFVRGFMNIGSVLAHSLSVSSRGEHSMLESGKHTYRGNVGMFRLGWRCGLMEEMLGPVTGIQDLEQKWLTMQESKPSVKFTLKMTGEGCA